MDERFEQTARALSRIALQRGDKAAHEIHDILYRTGKYSSKSKETIAVTEEPPAQLVIDLPVQHKVDEGLQRILENPSSKLRGLAVAAKRNKRKVIVTSSIAGVTILTIGAFFMVEHYIDKDASVDITDVLAEHEVHKEQQNN